MNFEHTDRSKRLPFRTSGHWASFIFGERCYKHLIRRTKINLQLYEKYYVNREKFHNVSGDICTPFIRRNTIIIQIGKANI